MFARVVLFVLCLLPYTVSLEAGFWDNLRGMVFKSSGKRPPTVDVLVVNDRPNVMLEVKGKYHLFDPNTNRHLSKRFIGKKKVVQPLSSGLKWGEEFPGIFQLEIVPEQPHGTTIIDGIEYKGAITIYDIGGSISIVNRVGIEDYLSSTLPGEYSETLPEETLSAIAITERTDTYYQSQNPKNKFWAIDGEHAGYRGLNSQMPESAMAHAINTTRYMVLSRTGAYEGKVTAFPAKWSAGIGARASGHHAETAKISLFEAEDMGRNGKHAAQILSNAFPNSHIELIY